MWEYLLVFHTQCSTPVIYLSVYVIWYLTSHPAISVLWRKGTGSFCCLVRWVCVGQMPCAGLWEWPNGYGEPLCTPEADLALFLRLRVSKASFHPFLDCVVFSLVTLIIRCSGRSAWTSGDRQQMPCVWFQIFSTSTVSLLSWKLLELCAQVQYLSGDLGRIWKGSVLTQSLNLRHQVKFAQIPKGKRKLQGILN